MAATRLIALHVNKGKTVARCLADRTDYSENVAKTNNGEFITGYMCDPKSCDQEFLLTKREYAHKTGRSNSRDIIAYQIRQSFKPGEVTPEEANQIGYETAMRWTKGDHAFIVATHIDRAHIHNHIIYNSTNLACDRKFKDFFFCGRALQKLSDIVCIEHGLSTIEPGSYDERHKRKKQEYQPSMRDELRLCIDEALLKKPQNFEELLKLLEAQNYEIKYGRQPAFRKKGNNRFIRIDTLGGNYSEDALRKVICGEAEHSPKKSYSRDFDLIVDIQRIISKNKGAGYERWARRFNMKQTAKALCFIEENGIRSMAELTALADGASAVFDKISDSIKSKDKRIAEIIELKKQIFYYAKTRDVYVQYRQSGYSKKFFEEHREEIQLHKAAKEAFTRLNVKKLPTIAELNAEFAELVAAKKKEYAKYHEAKDKMQAYVIAKQNIEAILKSEAEEKNREPEKEQKEK